MFITYSGINKFIKYITLADLGNIPGYDANINAWINSGNTEIYIFLHWKIESCSTLETTINRHRKHRIYYYIYLLKHYD